MKQTVSELRKEINNSLTEISRLKNFLIKNNQSFLELKNELAQNKLDLTNKLNNSVIQKKEEFNSKF